MLSKLPQKIFHESAGGIVFCLVKSKLKVALLKTVDNNWMMPKGHLKKAEKPLLAAIREIKEELGIKEKMRFLGKIGIDNFSFKLPRDEREHFKKVHIFLFFAAYQIKLKPATKEKFIQAQWFNFNQARQKLSPSIFMKNRFLKIKKIIIKKNIDNYILLRAEKIYKNLLLKS